MQPAWVRVQDANQFFCACVRIRVRRNGQWFWFSGFDSVCFVRGEVPAAYFSFPVPALLV